MSCPVHHLHPPQGTAVVPDLAALRRRVRHDARLSLNARLLFEDVCDLATRDGACQAGQRHFAEAYGTTVRTVKRWEKELRDAGYVEAVPSADDGRRRALRPTAPPAIIAKIGDSQRPLDRGQPAQIGDTGVQIGDSQRPEIGDSQRPTPRVLIIPPEGEKSARAREGAHTREASDSRRSGSPSETPSLDDVVAVATKAGVPRAQAEEFYWHYEAQGWVTAGEHPRPIRNWQAKLMQWRLRQPQFASGQATPSRPSSSSAPGSPTVTLRPESSGEDLGTAQAAAARVAALPPGTVYAEDAIWEAVTAGVEVEELFQPAGQAPDGTPVYRRIH